MQISGREYSKATVGLKQPKKLLDQQFKLVFIYPMLVDKKLNKYSDLIRSFVSTSMLKEIYTSNALNIVSMASSVSPLIDEFGNIVDVEGGSSDSALKDISKRETQQRTRYDIEQRIHDKTQHIEKLLNIDPQLKKYKPYIQMITLNNFIDVPVIVGTKAFTIEPHVFMFLFATAISSRGQMSLTSHSDVERMFKLIQSMNTNDVNVILNNLIDLPSKDVFDRVSDWITDHNKINRALKTKGLSWTNTPARWVQNIGRKVSRKFGDSPRQRAQEDTVNYPAVNPDLAGSILDITQSSIQEAKVFFKLCMDPEQMASQFGYDSGKGQLKETFDRINPRINEVFNDAEVYFTSGLWPNYIEPVISSFLYTVVPTRSGINVSDLIIGMQNGDQNKNINISPMMAPLIDYIKGDFKTQLNSSLERQGPEKADETLDQIKSLCQSHFEDVTRIIDSLDDMKRERLTGPDYNLQDHIQYEKKLEEAVSKISAMTSTLEGSLRDIFPNDLVNNLLRNKTEKVINDSLNSVISYLKTFEDYPESTGFIINANIPTNKQMNEISTYISESKKQLIFYIRFMVLSVITYLLCQYVRETKVSVETTKHDVLDQNNYTIVTSVELILALANAFAAKSYRNLVQQSNRGEDGKPQVKLMRDLSNNYIKGVVKYMHQQLDVPNLFVIDEKKGDVYYKLMYQSDVNKIKLNTMQTFVDSVLDK